MRHRGAWSEGGRGSEGGNAPLRPFSLRVLARPLAAAAHHLACAPSGLCWIGLGSVVRKPDVVPSLSDEYRYISRNGVGCKDRNPNRLAKVKNGAWGSHVGKFRGCWLRTSARQSGPRLPPSLSSPCWLHPQTGSLVCAPQQLWLTASQVLSRGKKVSAVPTAAHSSPVQQQTGEDGCHQGGFLSLGWMSPY